MLSFSQFEHTAAQLMPTKTEGDDINRPNPKRQNYCSYTHTQIRL